MPTRTHQAPPKGAKAPKTLAFEPRPFGETAPASASEPVPDPQEQIERAGRFGHNLARLSVPSGGEAPIQGMFSLKKLFGGGKEKDEESRRGLLAGSPSSSAAYTPPAYTPPAYVPPSPPPVKTHPSKPASVGPLPAPPPSASPVVVPRLPPPPSAAVVAAPVPVETPAARAKRLAREADQAKLRGMFNVTDELDIFDSSPNRISTQEFGEVSDLYSKIREGDSRIKFANKSRTGAVAVTANHMSSPEFTDFQGKAMGDIAKILQTPQGRTVLKALGAGGKTGTSDIHIGSAPNPLHAGQRPYDKAKAADGTGSGSEVYYGADQEVDLPIGSSTLKTTSDTALFHELVHAHHASQGTFTPLDQPVDLMDATSLQDLGVAKEEYATVGLGRNAADPITENAYRASHTSLAGANQALKDKYKKRPSYL